MKEQRLTPEISELNELMAQAHKLRNQELVRLFKRVFHLPVDLWKRTFGGAKVAANA